MRANASAGFSVVSWTSNASASVETMGTGLGVSPSFVIVKNRDLNDNWVISIEEMDQCVNPDFLWVKDLDLIPYEPKPTPPPFES